MVTSSTAFLMERAPQTHMTESVALMRVSGASSMTTTLPVFAF